MRRHWTVLAFAFVLAVAGVAAADNLVVNGGFEVPVVDSSYGWDIYPSGTINLGWNVEWVGSTTSFGGATRPTTANLELHRGVNGWAHAEGQQHTELDSDWDGPGGSLNNEPASVSIYQDISTLPGTYRLHYSYSPRPGHADNHIQVYWGGVLVGNHSAGDPGGNTSWTPVEIEVQAGAGTTRLEFREVGTADSMGMFLDDVQVELKELVCPELEVPLCAGQTMDAGTVTVSNDDATLYVTFTTASGWYLAETHVAVGESEGDIPQTTKGNPVPGQFPYACDALEPMATTCTVEIPLGEWCADTEIVVAAHAVVLQIDGDGCADQTFWADNVVNWDQGVREDGSDVLPDRTDPYAALFAPDGVFYSLGFDFVEGPDGWLTVGFGDPVFNGPGPDIVVQEVTNGRGSYPVERAEVFGVEDGTDYSAGVVTNKDGGDGLGVANLPDWVTTVDAVKLLDATDPALFSTRHDADGYDVDAIGACYLLRGSETAWGDGCDGTRLVERGNWGTYFTYPISACAPSCD